MSTPWKKEYHNNAKLKIREILEYVALELDDVNGAKVIAERLEGLAKRISRSPYRYRLHPVQSLEERGVRIGVVGSYHMLFTIIEEEHVVQILYILHEHQDASAVSWMTS